MRPCVASPPVERLRLVYQHVADFTFDALSGNRERVVLVLPGVRHWEAEHDACSLGECLCRNHEHGVVVGHLFAGLRVVLDEDDFRTIRHPKGRAPRRHQRMTSKPTGASAITSPAWRFGSKAASI